MAHFLRGYGRTCSHRWWLKEIPYFLKIREIELYAVIYRDFDLNDIDDEWCVRFMHDRKSRIPENDVPFVDFDFQLLATQWIEDDQDAILHRHQPRRFHRRRSQLAGLAGPVRGRRRQRHEEFIEPAGRAGQAPTPPTNGFSTTTSGWARPNSSRSPVQPAGLGFLVATCYRRCGHPFARGDAPCSRRDGAGRRRANVWIVGGGDLAGQFTTTGLLDGQIITIAPVTLGERRVLLPLRHRQPARCSSCPPRPGAKFVRLHYQAATVRVASKADEQRRNLCRAQRSRFVTVRRGGVGRRSTGCWRPGQPVRRVMRSTFTAPILKTALRHAIEQACLVPW